MNNEGLVIVLFFLSIFFYFALLKLYDLQNELKQLQKKKLNYQFRMCFNKGKMKAYREILRN